MDTETRKLLEEAVEVGRENNKILRKMQRAARWGRFFKIVFWLIIIGTTAGTYYYLQPILSGMIDSYRGLISGVGKIGEIGNSVPNLPQGFDIDSILKNLPKQ